MRHVPRYIFCWCGLQLSTSPALWPALIRLWSCSVMQTPRTSYMHGHGGQGVVNRMEACVNELLLLRFCPEISATIAILSWFSSLSVLCLLAGGLWLWWYTRVSLQGSWKHIKLIISCLVCVMCSDIMRGEETREMDQLMWQNNSQRQPLFKLIPPTSTTSSI